MARTYRSTSIPRTHFFWDESEISSWEAKLAKRDGQSFRYWTKDVKASTRRERRRDWRRSQHQIMGAVDYDEVDVPRLEKKYLGEIWNWD